MQAKEITSYQRGVDTRRLYAFEKYHFWGTEATRVLPMHELKAIAKKLWSKYVRGEMPKIVAGRGTPHGGALFSYSQGGYIQLSRNQRNKLVLVHELIHEMGYDEHDAGFIEVYLPMLADVLKLQPKELWDAARQYKLI